MLIGIAEAIQMILVLTFLNVQHFLIFCNEYAPLIQQLLSTYQVLYKC